MKVEFHKDSFSASAWAHLSKELGINSIRHLRPNVQSGFNL